MVRDNTAEFPSDSYSETEEVSDDGKEDGEGEEEDDEEGEEGVDDEDQNAELAQTMTANPASMPLPATSSMQDTTLAQVSSLRLSLRFSMKEKESMPTLVYGCIKQC